MFPRLYPRSFQHINKLLHSNRFLLRGQVRQPKNFSLSGRPSPLASNRRGVLDPGRSATTGPIAVIAIILGSFFLYYQSSTAQIESTTKEATVYNECTIYKEANIPLNMVGAIASGRSGNLTPDQEMRLQEFWKVTLKVFGISVQSESAANSMSIRNGNSETASLDSQPQSEKKKKKRISLFSKKRKDGHEMDDADAGSINSDDKYGQRQNFQQALASQSPEELRKAFWGMVKNDHPDDLLLRFLRARKWDVEKALVMLISTMHWRMSEMHVDEDVLKKGEGGAAAESTSSNSATKKEGNDFMSQLKLGKSFLHGTDKDGRPMCFVRVRLHKQGEQSEESVERYTVYVIETARLLLSPPIDTAVSGVLQMEHKLLTRGSGSCI